MSQHLVLAGGGHSHALLLHRWAQHPHRRPEGLITLVTRQAPLFIPVWCQELLPGSIHATR